MIELLRAMTTAGLVNDSEKVSQCVQKLTDRLNQMNFDVVVNELNYDEFNILYDAYMNMKFSEVDTIRDIWHSSFTNETLKRAFEQKDIAEIAYPESKAASYDPVKPRVMGGFTESLVKANLDDLYLMQANETQGMYKEMYPYAPDVLMGYKGQKVGVFVLNDDAVMRDSKTPCGFTLGKMKLVE